MQRKKEVRDSVPYMGKYCMGKYGKSDSISYEISVD